MSAFVTAASVIALDANMGTAATYQAIGGGAAVPVRLVRSVPDQLRNAFGTQILQGTDMLVVALAQVPAPEAGDTFTIGAEVLTVQHAERDAEGVSWRVMCQR